MGDYVSVGSLTAYLATGRANGPGMLLLPMITGIGEQIRDWADELAARGITALTWDAFHGRSTDNSTVDELSDLLAQLDDDAALAEQTQLLDHLLGDLAAPKAGVMGWCMGGRFALLLGAREHRLAGVTAFHPTVPSQLRPHQTHDAIADAAAITAPVLVSYPSADTMVSGADFEALQTSLHSRPTGATFTLFHPGADHGFTNRDRHAKPANADAFHLAWPQALTFIDTTTA